MGSEESVNSPELASGESVAGGEKPATGIEQRELKHLGLGDEPVWRPGKPS